MFIVPATNIYKSLTNIALKSATLQALMNGPAAELNPKQKKLKKNAEDDAAQKHHRHQEMILPESEALKKRLAQENKCLQKHASNSWAQQMSVDLQIRDKRFLRPSDTTWAARHTDRKTITEWIGGQEEGEGAKVYRTAQEVIHENGAVKKIWCIKDISYLEQGIRGQAVQSAVLQEPLLFTALLFGGYVVDRGWLKKARAYHGDSGNLIAPHWQLTGALQKPLELHVTGAFATRYPEIALLLAEAKGDRLQLSAAAADACLSSRWTVVPNHADVRQAKKAIILCGAVEQAEELNKVQQQRQEKCNKLAAKVAESKNKKPIPIALVAHVTELRKARKKIKNGRAVGPDEFVRIFLSMCSLAR